MTIANKIASIFVGFSLSVGCAQTKTSANLKKDKVIRIVDQAGYLVLGGDNQTTGAKRFAFEKSANEINVRELHDPNSLVVSAREDKNPPIRAKCPCDYFVAKIGDDTIHMIVKTGYSTDLTSATLVNDTANTRGWLRLVNAKADVAFQDLMDGEGLQSATYTVVQGDGKIETGTDEGEEKVTHTSALRLRELDGQGYYLDVHLNLKRSTPDYALELINGLRKPEICNSCVQYDAKLNANQGYRIIVEQAKNHVVSFSEIYTIEDMAEQIVPFKNLNLSQDEAKASFFSKEFLNWYLSDSY